MLNPEVLACETSVGNCRPSVLEAALKQSIARGLGGGGGGGACVAVQVSFQSMVCWEHENNHLASLTTSKYGLIVIDTRDTLVVTLWREV